MDCMATHRLLTSSVEQAPNESPVRRCRLTRSSYTTQTQCKAKELQSTTTQPIFTILRGIASIGLRQQTIDCEMSQITKQTQHGRNAEITSHSHRKMFWIGPSGGKSSGFSVIGRKTIPRGEMASISCRFSLVVDYIQL